MSGGCAEEGPKVVSRVSKVALVAQMAVCGLGLAWSRHGIAVSQDLQKGR